MREDLPTLDRPRMANSGLSSLGQSRARALLLTNSTCLILASPAYGPTTMLDPGRIMSAVTSSRETPGGMKRGAAAAGVASSGDGSGADGDDEEAERENLMGFDRKAVEREKGGRRGGG